MADVEAYLADASGLRGTAARVEIPGSEAAVAQVLRGAAAVGTPVTVAGAGTGVAGGRVPQGGVVLSLEKFRTLETGQGSARAGAGVLLRELQQAARGSGQFYAPDPTETAASLGGTLATNASGAHSFRYGDTRRHVRALRVALADGRIREFRRGEAVDFEVPALPVPHTTKNAAGFPLQPGMDSVDLFIGSEGTLGVILEAEVGLLPAPRSLLTGVVFFADEDAALDAVASWRGLPRLCMLEFLDGAALDLLRPVYREMPGESRAALIVEQEDAEADDWLERMERAGALGDGWFAFSEGDRERLRVFRHALPVQVNAWAARAKARKMGTDCAVPVAREREMFRFYRERLAEEFPGQNVIFGHVGDAHLHVNLLPQGGAEDEARGAALLLEFARRAVELGGTVSAEHGLGKRKAHLLELQCGAEGVAAMRAVKNRLDPHWLLGRGTLFGDPAGPS